MGFYYLYLTSKDYQKNENEDNKIVIPNKKPRFQKEFI